MEREPRRTAADRLVGILDQGLRTVFGDDAPRRASPARDIDDGELSLRGRRLAGALMRVNHTGEVCAQALYEGQAATAAAGQARDALLAAANEEHDHLGWCRERLEELEGRPSVLNPAFYAASFALGAAAGLLGERISLGFVEATEDEVCRHLDRHLERLPEEDRKSRAILAAMREDESRHGNEALRSGGVAFPSPVKRLMRLASRAMTESAYRI
ncbi:MAG: 2-polyprenyl-3-methyl-6-methoxy-1,4-benzoquinone monooxygenase [Gammaproteobacteria bacterium]|nr:2-polyprenyl-3-methyl-6-methoxy-1,4-benzoquinone monooxygenase [Gammaproteobacteria bacterium]